MCLLSTPKGKIFVLVFKSTPQCWNQHRSADFSTAARTYSRGGASGGVDNVCASQMAENVESYKTKWQCRNCYAYKNNFQPMKVLRFEAKIQPSAMFVYLMGVANNLQRK